MRPLRLAEVLAVLVMVSSLACASQSNVEQLQAENARLSAEITGLQQKVASLEANVGNLAADSILGEWNRAEPQSVRVQEKYKALRESVLDPAPGGAAQLNRALIRTANAAALVFISAEMVNQSEERQLEVLNQCIEYLLGITSATRACGLAPISP